MENKNVNIPNNLKLFNDLIYNAVECKRKWTCERKTKIPCIKQYKYNIEIHIIFIYNQIY